MSHRIEKLNHLIRREISDLLQRQVKDPRLEDFVAVTEVSVSPDLRYAKVFVSGIGDEDSEKETLKALSAASGFLRKELARNLKLRRVPELSFQWDKSIEHGEHILRLIDQVSSENG